MAFYELNEQDRVSLTERAISGKHTLYERWDKLAPQEAEPWAERASIAAQLLAGASSVADFGCGLMTLKSYLQENVAYFPVDVRSRGEETIICDFNRDPLPDISADAVACLGLLEYIHDLPKLMSELAAQFRVCVISYCITDILRPGHQRRAQGWVNDLSRADVRSLFASTGWLIDSTRPIGPYQDIWRLRTR